MLSTLFGSGSSSPDQASDKFQEGMASYFTKFIFQTVGYGLDEEIPFEVIRNSINVVEGDDRDLLKMFCGVD